MIESRIARLRERLAEEKLDAILITQAENRRYLSGFTGSEGILFISAQDTALLTDFRYFEHSEKESPAFRLVKIEGKVTPLVARVIREASAQRIGFESTDLTVHTYNSWKAACEGFDLVPTRDIVLDLRARKDAGEMDALRKAIALSDAAFAHIVRVIRPGSTEREVAWQLDSYMRTHGATHMAFDSIVGSGPNGAMPHAAASERPIQKGEPIVMDFGARVDGYNSDISRTVCLGEPDPRFEETYSLVLRAQREAEIGIRPGMTGREADAIAREIIEQAGHGKHFGHGLGHGVGLAVHEKPSAGRTSEDVLEPGAVVSVEPGVYVSGWGGVRIEDLVLITDAGVEVLTQASKNPVVV